MKILGLDDKEYSLKLIYTIRNIVSDNHKRARSILKELFPLDNIFEEVSLPGSKTRINKRSLTADFFIPSIRLMVEVQGSQHNEFVPFFHGDKMGFHKSCLRDNVKKQWCDRNGITLIQLPEEETSNEWRSRIENR